MVCYPYYTPITIFYKNKIKISSSALKRNENISEFQGEFINGMSPESDRPEHPFNGNRTRCPQLGFEWNREWNILYIMAWS